MVLAFQAREPPRSNVMDTEESIPEVDVHCRDGRIVRRILAQKRKEVTKNMSSRQVVETYLDAFYREHPFYLHEHLGRWDDH